MKLYCVDFNWVQYHRGTATIEARNLKEAKHMASEMDSSDNRIDFEPYDGELHVIDIEEAK